MGVNSPKEIGGEDPFVICEGSGNWGFVATELPSKIRY